MCGVFGFAGNLTKREWTLGHRLMIELAIASEERGTDAAGYAALTTACELLWQRRPEPARRLFQGGEFAALRRRRIIMAIGHTRLATTGAPAVNGNNHPHLAGSLASAGNLSHKTWQWAIVHNGWIPQYQEKAAKLGLRLKSQCDSEILAQALARYGEAQGPEVCLRLGGKQSVLAINTDRQALFAWTNGEMPLVAFRVEDWPALWWASTHAIARQALTAVGLQARFAPAQPCRVYQMQVKDGQVVLHSILLAESQP